MHTEQVTQAMAIVNGVPPQTLNNSNAQTGGVDMSLFKRAIFTLFTGTTFGGAVTASLQESTDNSSWPASGTASSFTGSGGANVQQTGITSASKIITFEVRADQLSSGKRYVRLDVKENNSVNSVVSVLAEGTESEHKPANLQNGTQVLTQNVVA
jgi:hypothetical protein